MTLGDGFPETMSRNVPEVSGPRRRTELHDSRVDVDAYDSPARSHPRTGMVMTALVFVCPPCSVPPSGVGKTANQPVDRAESQDDRTIGVEPELCFECVVFGHALDNEGVTRGYVKIAISICVPPIRPLRFSRSTAPGGTRRPEPAGLSARGEIVPSALSLADGVHVRTGPVADGLDAPGGPHVLLRARTRLGLAH